MYTQRFCLEAVVINWTFLQYMFRLKVRANIIHAKTMLSDFLQRLLIVDEFYNRKENKNVPSLTLYQQYKNASNNFYLQGSGFL